MEKILSMSVFQEPLVGMSIYNLEFVGYNKDSVKLKFSNSDQHFYYNTLKQLMKCGFKNIEITRFEPMFGNEDCSDCHDINVKCIWFEYKASSLFVKNLKINTEFALIDMSDPTRMKDVYIKSDILHNFYPTSNVYIKNNIIPNSKLIICETKFGKLKLINHELPQELWDAKYYGNFEPLLRLFNIEHCETSINFTNEDDSKSSFTLLHKKHERSNKFFENNVFINEYKDWKLYQSKD